MGFKASGRPPWRPEEFWYLGPYCQGFLVSVPAQIPADARADTSTNAPVLQAACGALPSVLPPTSAASRGISAPEQQQSLQKYAQMQAGPLPAVENPPRPPGLCRWLIGLLIARQLRPSLHWSGFRQRPLDLVLPLTVNQDSCRPCPMSRHIPAGLPRTLLLPAGRSLRGMRAAWQCTRALMHGFSLTSLPVFIPFS